MVRLLLTEGADVCAETNEEKLPRDFAQENYDDEGYIEDRGRYLEMIRTLEKWRTEGRC